MVGFSAIRRWRGCRAKLRQGVPFSGFPSSARSASDKKEQAGLVLQPDNLDAIAHMLGREFPNWQSPFVERVREGGSTRVYRVRTGGSVYYLRDRPEAGASLVPEAKAHQILRSRGVRVPEILYVSDHDPDLGRSIMVTSEIAGRPVGYGDRPDGMREILRRAGRDLAAINQLPVDGFGWVGRELGRDGALQAEFPTYAAWIDHHYGDCTRVLGQAEVLTAAQVQTIDEAIAVESGAGTANSAYLAHGDFDPTHIYQVDGQYSGIIDFGEMRGAPQLYDLAHFQIESRDLLDELLDGYRDVATLSGDFRQAIDFLSFLISLRRLSIHVKTGRRPLPPDLLTVRRWVTASQ